MTTTQSAENDDDEHRVQRALLDHQDERPERSRNPRHDAGEYDHRDAVADAAPRDLISQPHEEHRARGDRQHGEQGEGEPSDHDGVRDAVGVNRDRVGLDEGDEHGAIARPAVDLLLSAFFFLDLLQPGKHDCDELHDDRHRDVGHDREHEDGEVLERAPREEVQEILDSQRSRRALRGKMKLQRGNVDPGHREDGPHPVDHEDTDREEDPIPELLDPENVDQRVCHHFSSAAPLASARAVSPLSFTSPPIAAIFSRADADTLRTLHHELLR